QHELIQNFTDQQPSSVILTGTAGDGKTYYCRQVWEALGGSAEIWSSKEEIRVLTLASGMQCVVVKDLSSVGDVEQQDILVRLKNNVFGTAKNEVFLIAANDGQLVEALSATAIATEVEALKDLIEDLLVDDIAQKPGIPLKLYNLSRLQTAELFPSILRAVLDHRGWEQCTDCAFGGLAPIDKRCPIFENKARLQGQVCDENTFDKLLDLLRLCDLDGLHLPVRQQL